MDQGQVESNIKVNMFFSEKPLENKEKQTLKTHPRDAIYEKK